MLVSRTEVKANPATEEFTKITDKQGQRKGQCMLDEHRKEETNVTDEFHNESQYTSHPTPLEADRSWLAWRATAIVANEMGFDSHFTYLGYLG